MNQKEAIAYFEGWHLSPNAEDLYVNVRVNVGKMRAAIAAMTCPWVKTSDRLPMQSCDTAGCGEVFVLIKRRYEPGYIVVMERLDYIVDHPEEFNYWMPIPPLPELEEQGGQSI